LVDRGEPADATEVSVSGKGEGVEEGFASDGDAGDGLMSVWGAEAGSDNGTSLGDEGAGTAGIGCDSPGSGSICGVGGATVAVNADGDEATDVDFMG